MNLRLVVKILCLVFSIHIFAAAESHVNKEDFKIFIEKINDKKDINEISTFMQENSINSSSLSIEQRGKVFLALVKAKRFDLFSDNRFVFTDQNADSLFYFPQDLNIHYQSFQQRELMKKYLFAFLEGFVSLFRYQLSDDQDLLRTLLEKSSWLQRNFVLLVSIYMQDTYDAYFIRVFQAMYKSFLVVSMDEFLVNLFSLHNFMDVPISIERIRLLINEDRLHQAIFTFPIEYLLHISILRSYENFALYLMSQTNFPKLSYHPEANRSMTRFFPQSVNMINTYIPELGTPLDLARQFNNIKLIAFLLGLGAKYSQQF